MRRPAALPSPLRTHTARVLIAAVIGIDVLTACGSIDRTMPPVPVPPNATPVTFTGGTVSAYVASTISARNTGLMNRATIAADSGMLFVFGTDQSVSGPLATYFWMKDTSIPLSIAFLDASRRVLDVQDMAPFDQTTQHRPPAPYRFALETRQGWFAAHGVTVGATAAFTLPAGTLIDP